MNKTVDVRVVGETDTSVCVKWRNVGKSPQYWIDKKCVKETGKNMIFKAINGVELEVKTKRSAVIFELVNDDTDQVRFDLEFRKDDFSTFINYIKMVSLEVWPSLKPKDATSEASDYYFYYCKETDNNGFLTLNRYGHGIGVERSTPETKELYRFNKAKMQCFIFDLNKMEV